MARNTNVTGGNVHPNPPSPEWNRIQKELDRVGKMIKKAKGNVKGVGNPKPWKGITPKVNKEVFKLYPNKKGRK